MKFAAETVAPFTAMRIAPGSRPRMRRRLGDRRAGQAPSGPSWARAWLRWSSFTGWRSARAICAITAGWAAASNAATTRSTSTRLTTAP